MEKFADLLQDFLNDYYYRVDRERRAIDVLHLCKSYLEKGNKTHTDYVMIMDKIEDFLWNGRKA